MRKFGKTMALYAAASFLLVGGRVLDAGVRRDVDKLKHALGWDTMNLKTLAENKAGQATLERDANLVNRVERRSAYFSNGKLSTQVTTVSDRKSKRTLYSGKKTWSEDGAPVSVAMEDDTFNGDGMQMAGRIDEQEFKGGRLFFEGKKEYSPGTGQWGDSSKQTITYFDDGDMKERLTEFPASDEKTRENWGKKDGVLGREETTMTWNSSKGTWN